MKRMKLDTRMVKFGNGPDAGVDTRTGNIRRRWWTKARIPGTIRHSRMPGGSGYRGNRVWEGAYGG